MDFLIRRISFKSSEIQLSASRRRARSFKAGFRHWSKNSSDKASFLLLHFLWMSKENEEKKPSLQLAPQSKRTPYVFLSALGKQKK